jgi:hypothetical protein
MPGYNFRQSTAAMKPPARRLLPMIAVALLWAGAPLPAGAGERYEHDHDRARQALEEGEILPLPAILERAERDVPGQVMAVELDRDDGRWIYEIKVLRKDGSLVKLKLDAHDGTLLERRRHGDHRRRHRRDEER